MKTIIITLVMLSFSLVCEASIMPIEVNDFEVQETMLPEIKTDWTKNISCITEERTDYITRLRQIFWYSKLFAIFHVKISNPIDYPIPFPMGSMALNSSIPRNDHVSL